MNKFLTPLVPYHWSTGNGESKKKKKIRPSLEETKLRKRKIQMENNISGKYINVLYYCTNTMNNIATK